MTTETYVIKSATVRENWTESVPHTIDPVKKTVARSPNTICHDFRPRDLSIPYVEREPSRTFEYVPRHMTLGEACAYLSRAVTELAAEDDTNKHFELQLRVDRCQDRVNKMMGSI